MKHIILICLLICMATPLFAAESSVYEDSREVISTIYNDSKEGVATVYNDIKEIYPDIKQIVSSIATNLGVATEHVYQVLVKKYIVEGVSYLIKFLFGVVLCILGVSKLFKLKSLEDFRFTHIIYTIISICGIVIISMVPLTTMLTCLINPEWEVINYILTYAKTFV